MDGRNALDNMFGAFSSGHCTGLSLNVCVTGHMETHAFCKYLTGQYGNKKDARSRQYESRKATRLRAGLESK